MLGVAGNRVNVFLVAYTPPFATHRYVPSVGEIAVTVGLIAGLVLLYRLLVTVLPVLPAAEEEAPSHSHHGAHAPTAWGKW